MEPLNYSVRSGPRSEGRNKTSKLTEGSQHSKTTRMVNEQVKKIALGLDQSVIESVQLDDLTNQQIIMSYLSVAFINIVIHCSETMMFTVNSIYAGNMGDTKKLAAIGIGNTITNMLVIAFQIGANSAMGNIDEKAFKQ